MLFKHLFSHLLSIRKPVLRVVMFAALAAAVTARAATTNAPMPLLLDGVAAEVGETRITIAEVMLAVREMGSAMRLSPSEQNAKLRELYVQAQKHLVGRQLILKAYRELEQKLPPWLVDQRAAAVIDDHFDGDRSRLVSMLNRQGMNYDTWRSRLEEELIISSMRQQFVEQNVFVPPAAIRQYYATNQTEFAMEGTVRVGMIHIGRKDGEDAAANTRRATVVAERLRGGQDFRTVARETSDEAHAANGGDWSYVEPADVFRGEIVTALNALKVGEISPLIETESGYYIVTKFAETSNGVMPLDEAWPAIEAYLRRVASAERHERWIESLKQRTSVRLHPLP